METSGVSFSLIKATDTTLNVQIHGLVSVVSMIQYTENSSASLVRYTWNAIDLEKLSPDNSIVISRLKPSTSYRIRCITTNPKTGVPAEIFMSPFITTAAFSTCLETIEDECVSMSTYRQAMEEIAELKKEKQQRAADTEKLFDEIETQGIEIQRLKIDLKQSNDETGIGVAMLEERLEAKNNEIYDHKQRLKDQCKINTDLEEYTEELKRQLERSNEEIYDMAESINTLQSKLSHLQKAHDVLLSTYTAVSERSSRCIRMWKSRFYGLKNRFDQISIKHKTQAKLVDGLKDTVWSLFQECEEHYRRLGM